MKTLDEVIKAYECCQNVECDECPYKILFNDESHVPCDQFSKDEDALHYLKEYRSKHDEMLKMEEALGYCEMADNRPLTWSELKQMEGKPVWVEDSNDRGEWVLLSGTEDEYLYFVYRDCVEYKIYRDEQGKRWQAYRKERK